MSEQSHIDAVIPLVEERASLDKRTVETGKVRIRTVIDEKLTRVAEDLERDDVTIERVALNQEVTAVPKVREENGVLIVPVLEEVVFVEKRLVLKEELRVTRNRKRERVDEAVQLRQMHAEVERVPNTKARSAQERGERDARRTAPRLRRKEPLRPGRK